jgi:uncharacterized phage infection (PIP) family protein YhgE
MMGNRDFGPTLRNPATWVFVVIAGMVAFVTTFSYLGGFLDPDANTRNLPIALVNQERSADFAGKRIVLGDQVTRVITAPNPILAPIIPVTP